MKNLNLKFIGLFVFVALLFTACEEDIIEPGGGNDVPPSVTLVDDPGFVALDSETELGQSLKFKVNIDAGSSDLNTLTVFEDGSKVPLDRISLNANPALILGADKGGATYEIEIMPDASITEEGVYTYAFEVEDEAMQVATASVVVTTIIPFTALEMELTGVLLNQGGDTGTGGLDLDAGVGTGSSDEAAEIQDEGIDLDLTAANNWRQQISAANDADMVFIDDLGKALGVESITFDEIQYQEQVADAFAAGAVLDGDDANCNCTDSTNGESVSQQVNVGDIFAVKRGDRTYLLMCTEVNITSTDNLDSYEFSIKY